SQPTVTLNANHTTSNAGPDQTSAATFGLTTVTLAANTPTVGTGAWTVVSGAGGSFGTASSPTSTFSGTAGTTYTLRWTISNSPCTNSSDDVNVTFNTSTAVSISANYCMGGGGVALTCSPASSSYLWSDAVTTRIDTVDLA